MNDQLQKIWISLCEVFFHSITLTIPAGTLISSAAFHSFFTILISV